MDSLILQMNLEMVHFLSKLFLVFLRFWEVVEVESWTITRKYSFL
jgi:hypothetical protein